MDVLNNIPVFMIKMTTGKEQKPGYTKLESLDGIVGL